MAVDVISVTPSHGGFLCRYKDGGCTTISAPSDAQLLNYTNDTITYKYRNRAICVDVKTHSIIADKHL